MKEIDTDFRQDIALPWITFSLFWFILIICLGISMRLSYAFNIVLPTPIDFTRHAHSHTAFWAWAGPAFFGFILAFLIENTKRSKVFETILFWLIQINSLLALLSFILSGYSKLSIVFSSGMVFIWLSFSFYSIYAGKKLNKNLLLFALIRLSILMLTVSTLPTFLIPVSVATGFGTEMLRTISIHFFLDCYSEGWLYIMSFALFIFLIEKNEKTKVSNAGKMLLLSSIPLLILVSLRSNVFLFSNPIQWIILCASFLWGILQIIAIAPFIRRNLHYSFYCVIIFVLIKAILDMLIGIPVFTKFVQSKMFAVLYLHLKLLGIMSIILSLFIAKVYSPESKKFHYSKNSILLGVCFSLIALSFIALASIATFSINEIFDLNAFWFYGQILAFSAALLILLGVIILFVSCFYFSN
jgi:hypothetical protein